MKLKPFIVSFIILWALSAIAAIWSGDLVKAGSFGDSFGAVNALFSGIALALAIYSMILQQRQGAEFERKTLAALAQQAKTIGLIETNLVQQADNAKVTACTYLINHEEQRIETLKEWGLRSYKNENYYSRGIEAALARINEYHKQIQQIVPQ